MARNPVLSCLEYRLAAPSKARGYPDNTLTPLRPLSVFYHYGSAIEHGIDWPSFAAITLLAALITAVAAAAFARRDLYT